MRENNIHYVLGAPGSGKTAILPYLCELLPDWIVIDWDDLMVPAEGLTGRSIRENKSLWAPYENLMKSVCDMLASRPVLLLGVCTPDQLEGWHIREWTVLDCNDLERGIRLKSRGALHDEIQEAICDAAEYRALGLRTIDGTSLALQEIARVIASELKPSTTSQK